MHDNQNKILRPPTSGVPVGMRPPSRTGCVDTVPNKVISIVSRPLTTNGLPSANFHTGKRHVADKSYFIGVLRSKINGVIEEIKHLQDEVDQRKRGQSIQVNLQQIVDSLKKEITQAEEELADYNILTEHVQNGTHIDDMITEYQELEKSNHRCEEEVNKFYKEKRELEKIVVEQEKNFHDIINGKNYPEIQAISNEIRLIEAKCAELKKSTIDLNGKTREELLQIVKDTTKKIGDTEKAIKDEQKSLSYINKQIKDIEEKNNELQTDRGKKYLKLLQKEKDMNAFIENYHENLNDVKNKISCSQQQVYDTLINTSHEIESMNDLPTTNDYLKIKTELRYKEKQLKDTQSTMQLLQLQVEKQRNVLANLDEIDKRIHSEIESIKKSIKLMQDEMPSFDNIDIIKLEGEIKKKNKLAERDQLKLQLHHLRKTTNELTSKYNILNHKIKTDEIYKKLLSLENDIKQNAFENNAIMTCIEENKRITNYSIVKRLAMNIVNEINSLL